MLLDPLYLLDHLGMVLLLVLIVMSGKGLIFAFLSRAFRYRNIIPLAMGLGLSQVGEFSFVLGRVGVDTHSISPEFYSLVLTMTIVTMVLTPFISGLTGPIYAYCGRWFRPVPLEPIHFPKRDLKNHLVIAGGGRVGRYVAGILQRMGTAFLIIEWNSRRVDELKALGFPVLFGDAEKEIILEAAKLGEARQLLITTPVTLISQVIVAHAKKINPAIEIIARAEGIEEMKDLHDQGVALVVQPEFEASLEFARQALLNLDVPIEEIEQYTGEIRNELYRPLYPPTRE
jgi:CPA2 family monovalent cation:H+ antiporter-2